MSPATAQGQVDRFSAAITHLLGLHFEESKHGFLGEVLQRRLQALNRTPDIYLRLLEKGPPTEELAALARELTVGETYFFRNREQFQALAEVVLPERMRARAATQTLSLLCAACASGDEAYSLAIVAREAVPQPPWRVSIRAVDLNPASLEKARRARYSSWALRETSAEARQRWFRPAGQQVALDDSVRSAVIFEERNLAADDPDLWRPGSYDVVFCRNMLMYFSPDQAATTVARIAAALAPGGYFFLGHAETLRGLSDDFHLRHTHGAFYYERKERLAGPMRRAPAPPRRAEAPTHPVPLETFNEAWVGIDPRGQ